MRKRKGSGLWARRFGASMVAVLMVTLMVAPGCGGDGGANPLDPDLPAGLTEAEATAMVAALLLAFTPAPSIPSPEPVDTEPMMVRQMLVPTTTIKGDTTNTTVACPSGGSVAVMNRDSTLITVDARINPTPDTTFVANSTWSGTARIDAQYLACGVPDNSGGVWTFDANPGLVFDLNLNGTIDSAGLTTGGSFTSITSNWDGLWSGALNWSSGARSGSCQFSLAMVSTSTSTNGQSSYSHTQNGQMCGFNVSHSSSG